MIGSLLIIVKAANLETKDEQTPLHFASMSGKTDVIKLLVSKGAPNANAEDGKHQMMQ